MVVNVVFQLQNQVNLVVGVVKVVVVGKVVDIRKRIGLLWKWMLIGWEVDKIIEKVEFIG